MSGRGALTRADWIRIAASMTVTCALGAFVLGGVFLATNRYAEEARVRGERRAVQELLALDDRAEIREVSQFLTRDRSRVVYRFAPVWGEGETELVFALDGTLVGAGTLEDNPTERAQESRDLIPLGRIFAATRDGARAGFVIEGETRGYKNRIRFFVGLDSAWSIAGVKVVEHEEDPGLGAEVATSWFQDQFRGRPLSSVRGLDVTRDPMPEDWRAALKAIPRTTPAAWARRYGSLRAREEARPIYAVTGATISSRALTDGVRATILHFRRRWDLLQRYLGSRS